MTGGTHSAQRQRPLRNGSRRARSFAVALALTMATTAAAEPSVTPRSEIVRVPHLAAVPAPHLGPPLAPVTLEFFFDATSSVNRRAHNLIVALAERHPSRLRLVFRLVGRRGQTLLPEAALEAHTQGRFFEFLEALYDNRQSLKRERILEMATESGVDASRVDAAWTSGRYATALTDNMARRDRTGARGLPLVAFNGKVIARSVSSLSLDELEGHYDEAYALARDLIGRGVSLASLEAAAAVVHFDASDPIIVRPGAVDGDAPAPNEPLTASPPLLANPVDLSGLPARGASDAEVTLSLACSITSRNCARLYRAIDGVVSANETTTRLVFVPLFDIKDEPVRVLHEALMCAEEQDGYWRFLEDTLGAVHNSSARGLVVARLLDSASATADLDTETLLACVASGRHTKALSARVETIGKTGVTASPSLIIGGRAYPGGTYDPLALQRLIDRERQPGILERLWPRWLAPSENALSDM